MDVLKLGWERVKQAAPYIMVTGKPGTETAQYFIVSESSAGTESKGMKDAVLDLMATYYVFDIAYPTALVPLHIFFNTMFVALKISSLYRTPLPSSSLTLASFNNFYRFFEALYRVISYCVRLL